MDKGIKAIADHYGYDDQSMILIEEMSELTKAVLKYQRYKRDCYEANKEMIDDIASEIADVELMISQISYMFNGVDHDFINKIERIKNYKIERQLSRIKNGES